MDANNLKLILAGFCVAGLIAGSSATFPSNKIRIHPCPPLNDCDPYSLSIGHIYQ